MTLATWFGAGLSPLGPGTMGSLGALPLALALCRLGSGPYLLATLGVSAVGVWASNRAAELCGEKDPSKVVIDEVAGLLIAFAFVRRGRLRSKAVAFALFRVADIVKPGMIDKAQRLEPPGVGIMADDVLAGALAGAVTRWLLRVR